MIVPEILEKIGEAMNATKMSLFTAWLSPLPSAKPRPQHLGVFGKQLNTRPQITCAARNVWVLEMVKLSVIQFKSRGQDLLHIFLI